MVEDCSVGGRRRCEPGVEGLLCPRAGSTKTGSLGKSYITSAMASKACVMRLGKEHQRLGKEPVPNIEAEPR